MEVQGSLAFHEFQQRPIVIPGGISVGPGVVEARGAGRVGVGVAPPAPAPLDIVASAASSSRIWDVFIPVASSEESTRSARSSRAVSTSPPLRSSASLTSPGPIRKNRAQRSAISFTSDVDGAASTIVPLATVTVPDRFAITMDR